MDKKGIEIAIDLTTKEAERKLSEFQTRINNMRLSGSGGFMSQVAGGFASAGDQNRADRIEKMRQKFNQDNREKLVKDLKTQQKLLDKHEKTYLKMSKHVKNLTEGTDEHTAAIKRKDKAEKEYIESLKKEKEIQDALNSGSSMADAFRGKGRGPFSGYEMARMKAGFGRGFGRGMGEFGKASQNAIMRNPVGFIGTILGAIGGAGAAAVQLGGRSQLSIRTQEERENFAKASIQGTLSEADRLQSQRRGYQYFLYGDERSKAMGLASTRMKAERTKDIADAVGTAIKAYAGISLMAIGAAATVGTGGVGAPITGPMIAAGATMAAGGMLLKSSASDVSEYFTDDRKRSSIFDRGGAYEDFIGKKGAETYEKQTQALIDQDPRKKIAGDFFRENRQRMIRTQRALGLTDKELFGEGPESIYSKGVNAGFAGDVIDQKMMQMLQAGGTTKATKEGGIIAAQMERGLDLTNAASLMGKISGRTGGTAIESRDEIIRMYAEATRMGLDNSEVRSLLETSTQLAYTTGMSADQIQSMITPGVNVQSTRGIQAATSAFDRIRQQTKQMGGLRGQLAMAEFSSEEFNQKMRDLGAKDFKGFNFGQLAQVTSEGIDFSLENPEVRGLLRQMGIDPNDKEKAENILSEMRKVSTKTTTLNPERQKLLEQYGKLQEDIQKAPLMTRGKFAPEIEDLSAKLVQAGLIEEGQSLSNLDFMKRTSGYGIKGNLLRTGGKTTGTSEEDVTEILKSMDIFTRGYDKSAAGEAQNFGNTVKILNSRLEELVASFEKAARADVWTVIEDLGLRLMKEGKITPDIAKSISDNITVMRDQSSPFAGLQNNEDFMNNFNVAPSKD
jgi:hypothetical protein